MKFRLEDPLLLDAFRVVCYCLPTRRQTLLLAESSLNFASEGRWDSFEALIIEELRDWPLKDVKLVVSMLQLLLEEQHLYKSQQISLNKLAKLVENLTSFYGLSTPPFNFDKWLSVMFTCGAEWQEPLTPECLLKRLNRPAIIPKIDSIFCLSKFLVQTIQAAVLDRPVKSTVHVNIDHYRPFYGHIILARLLDELPLAPYLISDVVKEQVELYLDISRPFHLFKIDPDSYPIRFATTVF